MGIPHKRATMSQALSDFTLPPLISYSCLISRRVKLKSWTSPRIPSKQKRLPEPKALEEVRNVLLPVIHYEGKWILPKPPIIKNKFQSTLLEKRINFFPFSLQKRLKNYHAIKEDIMKVCRQNSIGNKVYLRKFLSNDDIFCDVCGTFQLFISVICHLFSQSK